MHLTLSLYFTDMFYQLVQQCRFVLWLGVALPFMFWLRMNRSSLIKDCGLTRESSSNFKPTFYPFSFSPATPTLRGWTQLSLARWRLHCILQNGRVKGKQFHCLRFLRSSRQVDCGVWMQKSAADRSCRTIKSLVSWCNFALAIILKQRTKRRSSTKRVIFFQTIHCVVFGVLNTVHLVSYSIFYHVTHPQECDIN